MPLEVFHFFGQFRDWFQKFPLVQHHGVGLPKTFIVILAMSYNCIVVVSHHLQLGLCSKCHGKKCSGSDASLGIPSSHAKKPTKKVTKKGDGETASDGEEGERSNNTAIIKWASPDLHYLTSRLITMISENQVWKQAFNFDTSESSELINSSGKKMADHQCEIAHILLQDNRSGKWADSDMKTLGIVIKNHSNVLKKKILELYNELGSTGHGLIQEDWEQEIWEDSAIANVWDKIQKCFPWYKELGPLLKASLVLDKDAATNSVTDLDLSLLITHSSGDWRVPQGDSGDEASESEHRSEDEDLVEGVPGSPHLDEPLQSQTVCARPFTARTNPLKASMAPMSQPTKKTCQSLLDKALELVASQNATITEVIKNNNRVRKEHKQIDSEIAIQMKKMQFAHEIVMLEKWMALKHKYTMECMECQKGAITPNSSVSSPAMQGFTDFMSDVPLSLGSGTAIDHFPNVFADYSLT
ncbi:hypothetical protein K439DRAFT_1616460 [Ramaria rubella]|nr:hypothetical protein K439DRAFT_1616460 [Ramaria rubella]